MTRESRERPVCMTAPDVQSSSRSDGLATQKEVMWCYDVSLVICACSLKSTFNWQKIVAFLSKLGKTSLRRHRMETFSTLLTTCAGNSPVTGEFPSQRPVTRSLDVFFHLCLNKRLSKKSWGWWFEAIPAEFWHIVACFNVLSSYHYANKDEWIHFQPSQQQEGISRRWILFCGK